MKDFNTFYLNYAPQKAITAIIDGIIDSDYFIDDISNMDTLLTIYNFRRDCVTDDHLTHITENCNPSVMKHILLED